MNLPRRRFLHLAAAAAALPATTGVGLAQTFPSRAITMVVPTAAGGAMDTFARFMAERMRVSLGQSVVIENIGGANGNIGVGHMARATPDGYTLIVGNGNSQVADGAMYTLQWTEFTARHLSIR